MEKNPQNDLVYPGERVDDLQNGLYVIQNPEKFCFGMDQFCYLDLQNTDRMKRFWIWEPERESFLFC